MISHTHTEGERGVREKKREIETVFYLVLCSPDACSS